MYDRHLDSFVKVVECGSFNAAGPSLFITGNSVMKQIDRLERDLGVRLFDRTAHGVTLTPAGKEIYESSLQVMRLSREAVARAKAIEAKRRRVIRLASSVISPTRRVGRWWSEVSALHPGIDLEIVQVVDAINNWMDIFSGLGTGIDAMISPEHPDSWPFIKTNESRRLFSSPASFGVPLGHRLVSRRSLTLSDLQGERVYLASRGYGLAADILRDAIESESINCEIVDCPPYDFETYNMAVHDGALMFYCLEMGDVHPGLVNIELEGFSFNLCLDYSKSCDVGMREFVDAICERAAAEQEGRA